MAYASTTKTTIEATRFEIQALLTKHGANRFFYSEEPEKAMVGFFLKTMLVKMTIPYGKETDQVKRSRWRALLLIIKARLEASAAGVSAVEKEFLADTVMADGSTVDEWMRPQLAKMVETGKMPATLMIEGPRK